MRTTLHTRRDREPRSHQRSTSRGRTMLKKIRSSSARNSPPTTPEVLSTPSGQQTSDFVISKLPEKIFPRTLHQWSVHHSMKTNKWIATIVAASTVTDSKPKHVQFPLRTEREARKFCKAYSPPKKVSGTSCVICDDSVDALFHCRNCGVPVCEGCSARWGMKMVPKTYNVMRSQPVTTLRVCQSCDWLSNAFCMALLQGRHEDAVQIVESGNVNLRSSFAAIHGEAIFPVHACVLGGNVETLKWLVQSQGCPLFVKKDPKTNRPMSLQTSASRTLLDLAMKGRTKIDVLMFLVQQGLSVYDVEDKTLIPRTLDAVLKAGMPVQSIGVPDGVNVVEIEESVATIEDACALCCERPMDCVLIPCGHQVCCSECGGQITSCPLCKVNCSVLRVFRH